MQVWTVANQKGGVAKTTTAVGLAGIAAEAGLRVLMLDMDPHGSLTSYFKWNPDQLESSTYNLFELRKNLSRESVLGLIKASGFERIDLIPAAVTLATLERQAIGEGMGLVVTRALALLERDYDLVLLDCPPQLGVLLVNAIAACGTLVVPVQTEFLAIQGLERILNTLNMLGKSLRKHIDYTIVPVMFDRRTQASVVSLRTLRNSYAERVWPGRIPVDTRLRDASKAGVPPSLFDASSHGVLAYRALYKFLLNENRNLKVG